MKQFVDGYKMPPNIDAEKAKKATPQILKDMEIHETIDLGRVHILRVWAGWIYWSFEESKVVAAVFVPQTTSEQS
jgi:hypothetical protein